MRGLLLGGVASSVFIAPIVVGGPATIQLVGKQDVDLGSVGATESLTYALTDGEVGFANAVPQAGDYVLIYVTVATNADKLITPITPGFTTHEYGYVNVNADQTVWCGGKFMGSTPDTTFEFSTTSSSTAHSIGASVLVFRNVDPITPVEASEISLTTASAPVDPPAVTSAGEGRVAVLFGSLAYVTAGGVYAFTPGDTLLNFTQFLALTGTTFRVLIGSGWMRRDAGVFDPAIWAETRNAAGDTESAITLLLKPKSL